MAAITRSRSQPYPFVPDQLLGVILVKNDARIIVWMEDGSVEAWTDLEVVEPNFDDEPSEEALDELRSRLEGLFAAGIRRPAEIVKVLEDEGYELIGSRRFSFASGRLYQSAIHLSTSCKRAAQVRAEILVRHGQRHPPLEHEDWKEWMKTVEEMNATALGARILGIASLEALANEILYVRFPKEYKLLEGGGKKAPLLKKLGVLLKLSGMNEEPEWFRRLSLENTVRRGIVHHEPMYEDDFEPLDSVEPSPQHNIEAVQSLMDLLDSAFLSIFAAFGVDVPVTHRPTS